MHDAEDAAPQAPPVKIRDLRLDFFRGLSLMLIFVNHSPEAIVSWISSRRLGFADASELFVFGSGFAAGIVYCRLAARGHVLYATLRLLYRVWTIYVAHVFIFVTLTAAIAMAVAAFGPGAYIKVMAALHIVTDAEVSLIQALLLKYQPTLIDILPLFIAVQLAFVPLIVPMVRAPLLVLGGSLALYLAARHFNWQLPAYPSGAVWFFNPLCWQALFIIGAFCCTHPEYLARLRRYDRLLLPLAGAYLLFAFVVAQGWNFSEVRALLPRFMHIGFDLEAKINLHPARLLHFLATAYVVLHFLKPEARWLRGPLARPLIRCGEFPLQVFCLSVLLAFAVHVADTELKLSDPAYVAANMLGLTAMAGLGYLAHFYRQLAGRAARVAA